MKARNGVCYSVGRAPSERGLVVGGGSRRGPRVALTAPGALLTAPVAAGRLAATLGAGRLAATLAGPRVAAPAEAAATAAPAGAGGLLHLGGGVLQAGTDLLDVDLED